VASAPAGSAIHTITEFNYRYTPSNQARIFVGVALSKGLDEKQVLIDKLSQSFDVLDMRVAAIMASLCSPKSARSAI
jgi:hypothetical protein